jgi:Co/Zn/Cd efflux system component
MKFFGFPSDASPRLKAVQIAQVVMVFLTMIATVLAAVIPQKHKAFTFSLLYSLIFTSITTTILVRKEQLALAAGALTKDKYVKYQLMKMISAVGLYIAGFILFVITPNGNDKQMQGEQGLWMNGVKVNRYQGWILWMHFFNW